MKKALLAVTLLLFWASFAVAQKDGVLSFTAADVHEFDTVNLVSLVPSFNIPLLAKSQGKLPGSFGFTSSQSCWVKPNAGGTNYSTYCGANPNLADLAQFNFIPNSLMSLGTDAVAVFSGGTGMCYTTTAKHLIGADGLSSYSIPTTTLSAQSGCTPLSATVTTNDGSGITATLTATGSGLTMSMTVSTIFDAAGNTSTNSGSVSDPFSNSVSIAGTNPNLTFTDTLGAVTDYTVASGGLNGSIKYNDTTGTQRTISMTNGTASTFQPLGSCGTLNTGDAVTPITSINFPDGTSFGFTWDTNNSGLDGLIKTITLPTGGTITYAYTVTALPCSGSWGYSSLSRTTSDGTTNYSASVASGVQTTTVKDPGNNKTVYVFLLGSDTATPRTMTVLQSITRYQNTGSVGTPAYTEISAESYCYNTVCGGSTPPNYPITTYEIKSYLGSGPTFMTDETETLDSTYGLVKTDATTDEITSGTPTITKTIVYGTDSSGTCVAITNTDINDHPCTITTKTGTTWLSGSTYSYNSNGALTSSAACLSSTCTGSSALTTTYTPTTHGTYSAISAPNNQTVNYTYGSCNSLMPTDVTTTVNSVAIDHKATWNCDAGLVTDTTDPNSNEADYTYDSMNRLHTYHDYMGDTNTTTYDYGTPTLDHVKVTDNIGVVSYQYNDGLGRPTVSQTCQTSGCSNLDTVSMTYGWKDSGNNALTNFQTTTSVPCVTTSVNSTCSTVAVTALTNPIAGPYKTTDANSGTGTYAVNSKDFSFTAGPAPGIENTKVVQTEVDGFGRITSTCSLESSGGTTCGQTMGNSGILTSNVYSFATGAPKVVTTRGSQSHTTIADAIGRTTSIQTPEGGTVTYTYDSATTTNCGTQTSGYALLEVSKSGSSIYNCYLLDILQRPTDIANTTDNSTNPCKRFRYDSTANNAYTKPTGYPTSGANLIGRLMEASTDDCTFPLAQAHMITDEWFAYDAMGRMTDMWEYTTTGATFYHTTVAYDADGVVTSFSGLPGTSSTLTYTTDGEDRWNAAKLGTTTLVPSSGVTYDAASRPTQVNFGTGTDKATFAFDNVGNVTQEQYFVGSKNRKDVLTWNSIGSLGTLAITDGFSSNNSQTCNFGTSSVKGYDDVGRLLSDNCGTVWAQTFTWDQYDNLKQSGSASYSPTYTASNNNDSFVTYDSDGNITKDSGSNNYTYNAYGQIATINSGSTIQYDAFGREVANPSGSTGTETLYSPMGRTAVLSSGTSYNSYIPLPGGLTLVYDSGGYLGLPDWRGDMPVMSIGGTVTFDRSFAPFGQVYQSTATNTPIVFSGTTSDLFSTVLYDTPNRELGVASGRWFTPDPAHSGWNAYAYVTDPNTQTDPSGLGDQRVNGKTLSPGGCTTDLGTGFLICNGTSNPTATGGGDIPCSGCTGRGDTIPGFEGGFLSGWTGGQGTISRPTDLTHRIGRWVSSQLGLGDDPENDNIYSGLQNYAVAAGVGGEGPFLPTLPKVAGYLTEGTGPSLTDISNAAKARSLADANVRPFYIDEASELKQFRDIGEIHLNMSANFPKEAAQLAFDYSIKDMKEMQLFAFTGDMPEWMRRGDQVGQQALLRWYLTRPGPYSNNVLRMVMDIPLW